MATFGDQEKGSSVPEETVLRHSCSPCNTDGKQASAVGYCVNCEEYLCQRCFDVHLIPSLMRKHKLLDKEHFPSGFDGDREGFSSTCPKHEKEVINYHCPTHSFLGCHLCFYIHQISCKDAICIPEDCKNLTNTTEYKEFAVELEGFTKICMQTTTDFKGKLRAIESDHAKTIADIKEFKKQLLDAVDKAEKVLLDTANKHKEECLTKAKELNDKCNAILKENLKMTAMVDQLQRSDSDIYIAMVKTRSTLRAVEDDIDSFANNISKCPLSFKANTDILKELYNPWALGKLTKAWEIQSVDHKLDINIKSGIVKRICRPIGYVLCENTLVITDQANRSVKLIDITSNKLTSEFKLSTMLGLCKISDDEVAVAVEKKVVFVKIRPTPRKEREITITGEYNGLGYCDKRLALSHHTPPKVEVLDMQGNVLNTFVNDDQGHDLFSDPFHLTVNPDNKLIYVSNHLSHNVVCMKFDGTVVAKYTDSELRGPRQVITDVNGMVYVCGDGSHNLHQMTEECRKVKVILTKADGLNNPESICYDESHDTLYIGQSNSDLLKVYSVTKVFL